MPELFRWRCPEKGREFTQRLLPYGRKKGRKRMKKVLNVVAVCAVVLLALTGCTGQADTAGSSTSESHGIVVSDTDQKETSSLSESTGDVSSDEKETVSDAES